MLACVMGEACGAPAEERAERVERVESVPGAFLADLAHAGVSLAQDQLASHFQLQAAGKPRMP
jgi:hypothetical protein